MKLFYLCYFLFLGLAAVEANGPQLIPLKETIPDDIASEYMAKLTKNSSKRSRIRYGTRVSPGQFPYATWLNLLVGQKIEHCGGSLISRNFVLSAASCLHSTQLRGIDVYLGSIDMTAFPFKTSADAYISHEEYNPQTHLNDISLIRMRLFVMNPVAVLPKRVDTSWGFGAMVYGLDVAGWGLNEKGVVSQYLVYTNLIDLPGSACGTSSWINSSIICGSSYYDIDRNSRRAAAGDIGGPMEISYGYFFGVTSFLTDGGYHGFTRVAYFLDWISYYTGIRIE